MHTFTKIIKNQTPEDFLVIACENNNLEKVKELINEGVKAECEDGHCLEICCKYGFKEILQFLLDNGAKSSNKYLRIASRSGHLEIVKIMVENGADVETYDNYCLKYACGGGFLDVVEYLISKGGNISAENDEALIFACQEGHDHIVQYLLKKGADPKAKNGEPLRYATQRHKKKCENIILENIAKLKK